MAATVPGFRPRLVSARPNHGCVHSRNVVGAGLRHSSSRPSRAAHGARPSACLRVIQLASRPTASLTCRPSASTKLIRHTTPRVPLVTDDSGSARHSHHAASRSGPAKGPFALKLLASRASRVGGLRAQAETEVQGQSTTGYSCRGARWVKPRPGASATGSPARVACTPRATPPRRQARTSRTGQAARTASPRPRRLTDPGHRHRQQFGRLVLGEEALAHPATSRARLSRPCVG